MAVNLYGISKATTTARSLSNLILVNPQENSGIQPQNLIGQESREDNPKNFLFNYNGEEVVTLESDITDHYTEENSAINDQISLKPEMIRVQGYIGELNDVIPFYESSVKLAFEKLTALSAYEPELSVSAMILFNRAVQAVDTAQKIYDSGVSSWSTITGQDRGPIEIVGNETAEELFAKKRKSQTKQQKAFNYFYGYWKNRTLFTVQTPWAIFKNMAIHRIEAVQDPDTRMYSIFNISFKIIRYAKTVQELLPGARAEDSFQARARASVAQQVNKVSTPAPSISLSGVLA